MFEARHGAYLECEVPIGFNLSVNIRQGCKYSVNIDRKHFIRLTTKVIDIFCWNENDSFVFFVLSKGLHFKTFYSRNICG